MRATERPGERTLVGGGSLHLACSYRLVFFWYARLHLTSREVGPSPTDPTAWQKAGLDMVIMSCIGRAMQAAPGA